MLEAKAWQGFHGCSVNVTILSQQFGIISTTILVDAIHCHIICLEEQLHLLLPLWRLQCLVTESKHAEMNVLVTAVHQYTMLLYPSLRCLWLCQENGIHLIVEQHLQADSHVIDLHTIHVIFRLGAIYRQGGELVGGGITGDGYHLVGELLQFRDT